MPTLQVSKTNEADGTAHESRVNTIDSAKGDSA